MQRTGYPGTGVVVSLIFKLRPDPEMPCHIPQQNLVSWARPSERLVDRLADQGLSGRVNAPSNPTLSFGPE